MDGCITKFVLLAGHHEQQNGKRGVSLFTEVDEAIAVGGDRSAGNGRGKDPRTRSKLLSAGKSRAMTWESGDGGGGGCGDWGGEESRGCWGARL